MSTDAEQAAELQAEEAQTLFAKFAEEADRKFIESRPEFADPALQKEAVEMLRDLGFTYDELAKHWSGQEKLSLRDHRMQALLANAVKYRQAQAAARKAVKGKTLPPVQRPGGCDEHISG